MTSYEAILRSYRADAERRASEEAWWSDSDLNLRDAIRRATLSEIPSRGRLVRYSHQCRLSRRVLAEAAVTLTSLQSEIARSSSFEELYDLVSNVCSTVCGAGDLFAYDVAQRLGLRLGLHPDRVYLHTGVRIGARALGIPVAGRKSIGMDELPPALRSLSPSEAEDVLCIYKSYLAEPLAGDESEVSAAKSCSVRLKRAGRC